MQLFKFEILNERYPEKKQRWNFILLRTKCSKKVIMFHRVMFKAHLSFHFIAIREVKAIALKSTQEEQQKVGRLQGSCFRGHDFTWDKKGKDKKLS